MSRPPHPPRLYNSNYTWRRLQIMKLLVMQFPPTSRHSIPLWSKYSPQHPVLKHPQFMFLIVQWLPGLKRPGSEADHSPPTCAEVKNTWIDTSTPPIRLHCLLVHFTKPSAVTAVSRCAPPRKEAVAFGVKISGHLHRCKQRGDLEPRANMDL
jgi:hypothetical protein